MDGFKCFASQNLTFSKHFFHGKEPYFKHNCATCTEFVTLCCNQGQSKVNGTHSETINKNTAFTYSVEDMKILVLKEMSELRLRFLTN